MFDTHFFYNELTIGPTEKILSRFFGRKKCSLVRCSVEIKTRLSGLHGKTGCLLYSTLKWITWAMPGMLSPCCWDVGDISAPVAVKRTFL